MSNESRAAISARLLAAPPEPPRRETALGARRDCRHGGRGHGRRRDRRRRRPDCSSWGVARGAGAARRRTRRRRPRPERRAHRSARSEMRVSSAPSRRRTRSSASTTAASSSTSFRSRLASVFGSSPITARSRFGEPASRCWPPTAACDRCRCRAGASRCDRAAGLPSSTPVTDGSRRRRRRSGAPGAAEAPPARHVPVPKPRANQRASAAESALFDRAWSSLRAGNAGDAAATFADLERRARGRAIEEDALYWRAVSVARTKDSASAGLLFREFLRRFPASSRRGEAAVALGWILLDAENVERGPARIRTGARRSGCQRP